MSTEINLNQHDFTAGEISDFSKGRSDQDFFRKGLNLAENMLLKSQGPMVRRPPTKFITTTVSSGVVRLEPMQPNAAEGYVIEFSANQIRMLRSSDDTIVDTVATNYLDGEINDLKLDGSIDVVYITHENHPPAILERITASDFQISDIEFKDGPYEPQTDEQELVNLQITSQTFQLRIVSTGSPYTGAVVGQYVEYKQEGVWLLGQIDTVVSVNEVVISPVSFVAKDLAQNAVYHVNTNPTPSLLLSSATTFRTDLGGAWARILDKQDNTTKWVRMGKYRGFVAPTVTQWDYTEDGNNDNADAIEIDEGPVTFYSAPIDSVITEETNEGVIVSDADLFESPRDIGRFLRLFLDRSPVVAQITSVTNAREVNVSISSAVPRDGISDNFLNEGRTNNWRFGAFYPGNYPRAVALFQQRLWFGGTPTNKEAFWGSVQNRFFTFSTTDEDGVVQANSSIGAILDGTVLNEIKWLHASQVLFIGTEGGEFRVSSSGVLTPITPLDIVAVNESKNGSDIPPVEIDSTVLFLQLGGQKLREFEFSFQVDKFITLDISILSDHIYKGDLRATEMSFQKEPNSVLWMVRNDGQLVALTFIKEQEIRGWTRHIIGGEDAKVLSIANVRHSNSRGDIPYVVVERVVDGSVQRYIEKIDKVFSPNSSTDTDEMVFVDSYKKFTGPFAANSVYTGLDHLEGYEVTVVIDGAVRKSVTVSGGQVTLEDPIARQVYIGLSYLPIISPYLPEIALNTGTHRGAVKRIDHLNVLLVDTIGLSAGPSPDQLTLRSFQTTDDPMDNVPPLRSGFERVEFEGDYDREDNYYIAQEQPYPLNIASIVVEEASSK